MVLRFGACQDDLVELAQRICRFGPVHLPPVFGVLLQRLDLLAQIADHLHQGRKPVLAECDLCFRGQ